MNLADLSRMDIKDLQKIDYKKMVETLRKRNDILINLIIVLLSLILTVNIMSKSGKKIRSIKKEIGKLEKKITVINNLDAVKAELQEFSETIPEALGEDDLATKLTDWAVARDINIVSVSPVKTKEEDLHNTSSIDLNIETDDYAKLWLFVNDIESSPYALRIDRWQIKPSGQYRSQRGSLEPVSLRLLANTTVTTVQIKDE